MSAGSEGGTALSPAVSGINPTRPVRGRQDPGELVGEIVVGRQVVRRRASAPAGVGERGVVGQQSGDGIGDGPRSRRCCWSWRW